MAAGQPSGKTPGGDHTTGSDHNHRRDEPDAGQPDPDATSGKRARAPSEARTREEYARDMRDQGPPIPDDEDAAPRGSSRDGPTDSRGPDDQATVPDTDADRVSAPGGERSFSSPREAAAFMETEIDRPVTERLTQLGEGIRLHAAARSVGESGFANVYDIACEPGAGTAPIHVSGRPVEPKTTEQADGALVTTSAGFFFLADKASGLPRQASLNLAIDGGRIVSLPVVDREAVMTRSGVLSADHIRADGGFAINGSSVTWTGSRTGRSADCYVYGNGNAVITHEKDAATGTSRVSTKHRG